MGNGTPDVAIIIFSRTDDVIYRGDLLSLEHFRERQSRE